MKPIVEQNKPTLILFLYVFSLSLVVIMVPKFHFLLKIFFLTILIFWIDGEVFKIIENKGLLEIRKGYLFKRKKIVVLDAIEKIIISFISNKGGYGFEISIETRDGKTNKISKQGESKIIDEDVKMLKEYFTSKNIKLVINALPHAS